MEGKLTGKDKNRKNRLIVLCKKPLSKNSAVLQIDQTGVEVKGGFTYR